ncbi:hypothetical protein TSUD_321390 [Trifolium subterraneum]|uniref:Uncharacterized protein n=1 Tax=Trifolium subterraneum TaxID=3900 RepID=A0A2Z6N2I4_TRISU|nr:hypothetical protein TSUD_321390 [Trifolium subterraneum]
MAQKKEFKEISKLVWLTITRSIWIQMNKIVFDWSLLNLVEVVEMIEVRSRLEIVAGNKLYLLYYISDVNGLDTPCTPS